MRTLSSFERFRIWLKSGHYEVVVARNREEAVAIAIREKGVREENIKSVGRATSRGRLYQYPFKE